MIDNPKTGMKVWAIQYVSKQHICPDCGREHSCEEEWRIAQDEGHRVNHVEANLFWAYVTELNRYRIEDLFLSITEAQAECDKRNKKGAKNDVDGRDA